MEPSDALNRHRQAVIALDRGHRAGNVRVLGSVCRAADADGSDPDLLVDFGPDASLLDAFALRESIASLLACPVELATPGGLHPLIRERVLREARPL